jgi:hypothetical protein
VFSLSLRSQHTSQHPTPPLFTVSYVSPPHFFGLIVSLACNATILLHHFPHFPPIPNPQVSLRVYTSSPNLLLDIAGFVYSSHPSFPHSSASQESLPLILALFSPHFLPSPHPLLTLHAHPLLTLSSLSRTLHAHPLLTLPHSPALFMLTFSSPSPHSPALITHTFHTHHTFITPAQHTSTPAQHTSTAH